MTLAVAILSVVLVAVLYRQVLQDRRMENLSLALRRAAPEDRHVGGQTLRFPVDLPGRVRIGGEEVPVRVVDLSVCGAQVVGATGLEVGQVVTLTLDAPVGEKICDAQVKRIIDAQRAGLRFNKPSPGFLAAIRSLRGQAVVGLKS